MNINLNESVKVKLTDWGKEIFYHQYDMINKVAGKEVCQPRYPKEDENGYTEFQLWCFMVLYGEHMGMTLPNVIEPLEIVYESEPERKMGKWQITRMNTYELSYGTTAYEPVYLCSACGSVTESYLRLDEPIMPEDADFPKFCPNCGAMMEV